MAEEIEAKIQKMGLNPSLPAIAGLLRKLDSEIRIDYMLSLRSPNGRRPNLREVERAIGKDQGDSYISTTGESRKLRPKKPKWPEPDLALQQQVLVEYAQTNLAGLESPDDVDTPAIDILLNIFKQGEFVCVARDPRAAVTELRDDIEEFDLPLFVPSPMKGETGLTQEGKESPRCNDNTGERRILHVEFDRLPDADDQIRLHMHLADFAPLVYITHSGGKSYHGAYWIDGLPEEDARRFMEHAVRCGADRATWTRCQLVRVPNGVAFDKEGQRQKVHYLDLSKTGSSDWNIDKIPTGNDLLSKYTFPKEDPEAPPHTREPPAEADQEALAEEEDVAEEFPIASLPREVRNLCLSAQASLGLPMPLIALNALGIASTALGGGAYSELIQGRKTLGNAYVLISAPSGIGKSACYKVLSQPLEDCEKEQVKLWEESRLQAQSEVSLLKHDLVSLKKALSKEGKSEDLMQQWHECEKQLASAERRASKASRPCITVNDFTEEALLVCASHQQHQAVGIHTPEGRAFFKIIMGRYGGNGATAETILLAGFSGDACKVTRLSRESAIVCPVLSLVVAVQDDVFRTALSDTTFTESGLFPRCLIYRSFERIKPGSEFPPPIDAVLLERWNSKVIALIAAYRYAQTPQEFVFTQEATKAIYIESNWALEKGAGFSTVHDAYNARYGENLTKICMILHAMAYGEESHTKDVAIGTVRHGVNIMRWVRLQQEQLLGDAERSALSALKERVVSLVEDADGSITLRKLKNSHGITLQDCDLLVKKFSCFKVTHPKSGKKGGRPSPCLIYDESED
jgi:hypothetical protein